MATSNKLDYLLQTKEAIKTSLKNKGVEVNDTDTFRSYASKIDNIENGGGDISEYFGESITGGSQYSVGYVQAIKKLPTFKNTGTTCAYMFYYCPVSELDLSKFDTSNVINMCGMFYGAKVENLNLTHFDTSNVTDMSYLFYTATNLAELNISNWNTSKVTNMIGIFNQIKAQNLDLSSFDFEKVVNISNAFMNCSSLTNLIFGINLGKGYTRTSANYSNYTLTLNQSNKLTHDSLMSVINNLYDLNLTYDVANGGTLYRQKLVLGATNLAKLTDEEIAIATNKGWTVS